MRPRITIISVFGHRNKGDAAIFRSLLLHVERLHPGAEIAAVVRHPETERDLYPRIRIEEQLLRSTAARRPVKLLEMVRFALGCLLWVASRPLGCALLPTRKRSALDAIARAELVLSCGGGFLHDSFPGFVVHLFEMYVVQRLGKPLILTGQSIGPFRSHWSRRLARRILDRCDLILPRERISLEYLRSDLGVTRPGILLIPDLAFSPDEGLGEPAGRTGSTAARIVRGPGLVGVTVRHWNFAGRASEAGDLNRRFQEILSDILDSLVARTGYRIVFFPQAISAGFSARDDRAIARKVAGTMEHGEAVTLIEEDLPVPELRQAIARCDLFVGTRMHSNIFALSAGVPTLAISYLPKTRGIMELVGLGEHVVDMTAGTERFQEGLRRLVESQDEIRSLLRKRMPDIRASIADVLSQAIDRSLPVDARRPTTTGSATE